MMTEPASLPSDGPALALAEAARRRGLRYSRAHVRGLVERHPQAGSLLALVEVAPMLGLEPTAGQGDLEALDALEPGELPAVLHFARDGEQGFGLLEAVLPGGTAFRVWDSVSGARVLPRGELASLWSGVVVFLEPKGKGAPEPGGWHRLAREWALERWRPRTGLVGPTGSP
ncbi:MAG TPA: cysteine peptidase family C39 domain-containing protein, partial [Myxococcus sp.]|nr:cysteine peptidase family C39 domain-containing protein [Myxococcus sp.]